MSRKRGRRGLQDPPARFFMTTNEQPLKTRKSYAPSRIPTFLDDVLGITFMAAMLGGALVGAYKSDWRWFFIGAGAVGLLALIWRLNVYDRPDPYEDEREYQKSQEPPETINDESAVRYNAGSYTRYVPKTRPDKELKVGSVSFRFSGRNLDALVKRLNQPGGNCIRKETSSSGPGFDTLPESIQGTRYTDARYVLVNSGMVHDATNEWTQDGLRWIRSER